MTIYRPVIWTAELRTAAADLTTTHREAGVSSRAQEVWNEARVGSKLNPAQCEFVAAMRSRFGMAQDAESRGAEARFDHAWASAWEAAVPAIMDLPLNVQEAHALLRLIATANDHQETERFDRQTGTWIADRLVKMVEARR